MENQQATTETPNTFERLETLGKRVQNEIAKQRHDGPVGPGKWVAAGRVDDARKRSVKNETIRRHPRRLEIIHEVGGSCRAEGVAPDVEPGVWCPLFDPPPHQAAVLHHPLLARVAARLGKAAVVERDYVIAPHLGEVAVEFDSVRRGPSPRVAVKVEHYRGTVGQEGLVAVVGGGRVSLEVGAGENVPRGNRAAVVRVREVELARIVEPKLGRVGVVGEERGAEVVHERDELLCPRRHTNDDTSGDVEGKEN